MLTAKSLCSFSVLFVGSQLSLEIHLDWLSIRDLTYLLSVLHLDALGALGYDVRSFLPMECGTAYALPNGDGIESNVSLLSATQDG